MFGRRKTPDQKPAPKAGPRPDRAAQADGPVLGAGAANRSRPVAEPQTRGHQPRMVPGTQAHGGSGSEGRKLVVGQDIQLSGEIKKCEKLVVEGEVKANLSNVLSLDIPETGLFRGAAVVEQADVSGCFDGELTVTGTLTIRATGEVRGTIRYADLEIERGGKLAGDIDLLDETAGAVPLEVTAVTTVEDLPEVTAPTTDTTDTAEATPPAENDDTATAAPTAVQADLLDDNGGERPTKVNGGGKPHDQGATA